MDVLSTALMWRELGVATIPILYRSKAPALDSWRPYMKRLPTKFELKAWFQNTQYNIAVVTGWQGLVIVDWDDAEKLIAWMFKHPTWADVCPYRVETPRGLHMYFYTVSPAQYVRLDGVDIKAAGGYCLTPPSIHPNGRPYIAIGSPADIETIFFIDHILPEYQQAISRPPPVPRASTLHPLDAAMLPHTSISIESIKANWTIADVLNTKARPGRVWHTVCPLHDDTNPSLAVYPDGHWWCYAEARGGDVIDLYAAIKHISVQEAIAEMGKRFGNGE